MTKSPSEHFPTDATHGEPVKTDVDLENTNFYINRELSHLQFNARVLEQALDEDHPLLERVQFLLIFGGNIDEFYEIRVAGLKQQIMYSREATGADGIHPKEVLRQISDLCHALVEKQYDILKKTLLPELSSEGIQFLRRGQWNDNQAKWVKHFFRSQIIPVISPIGLDPAHPFPQLVNKSLNFIVSLEGKDAFGRDSGLAIIPMPRSLAPFVQLDEKLSEGKDCFIFLSSIIHAHIDDLFPGMTVKEAFQFRITRNADLELNSAEVEDIARALQGELHSRRFGSAVRLEIADDCPKALSDVLLKQYNLDESELFRINGPLNLNRIESLSSLLNRPEFNFPPFTPGIPNEFKNNKSMFDTLAEKNILLYHPFQSFTPVVDLLRQAAADPNVLAIKQTLYRTGAQSVLVDALVDAAKSGKEVTVVVELRARFDEEENIKLAGRMHEAGAVVVYGVVGYKTHAKMMLIVRKEGKALRRYVHLGTGNYHASNARLYTDYSLMTNDKDICADVHKIFQQLTGMGKTVRIKKILHAPFTLKKQLINLINNEAEAARSGLVGKIIIKINSLTEPDVIKALYKASIANVKIELIVRGVCCLRPGIPNISENIHVRSVVGRFLEHARVYYFENAQQKLYCASADLMERNLTQRVEVCFPIEDRKLAACVLKDLDYYLKDNIQSWELLTDGSYQQNRLLKTNLEKKPIIAQQILLEKLT